MPLRGTAALSVTALALGALLLLWPAPATARSHAGTFDASFGRHGRVVLNLRGPARALALASGGRVLVGGGGQVARVRANGQLDRAFGHLGVAGGLPTGALSLSTNGKLLVGGPEGSSIPSDPRPENIPSMPARLDVARLTSTGGLDPSFASGGRGSVVLPGSAAAAQTAARQPDGGVVVAGEFATGRDANGELTSDLYLARLDASGQLERGFGSGGLVRADLGTKDQAKQLLMQSDGKLLLFSFVADCTADAGENCGRISCGFVGVSCHAAVSRYNADGSIDRGFGGGQFPGVALAADEAGTPGLSQLPSGRLLVLTSLGTEHDGFRVLATPLTASGRRDPKQPSRFLTHALDDVFPIAAVAQPDGRTAVVAAGGFNGIVLFRVRLSLRLDSTFGRRGFLSSGGRDVAYTLARQSDGKLVIAGTDGRHVLLLRVRGR